MRALLGHVWAYLDSSNLGARLDRLTNQRKEHPMSKFVPPIGSTVIYKLNKQDALEINRRRGDYSAFVASHPHPHEPGQPGATGHQAHVGNPTAEGQVFPALIVARFPGNPEGLVNLQVILDGSDTYWATSRKPGDEPGQWRFFDASAEPAETENDAA